MGPVTPPAINNKNYFVIFVDQYTHYCVTYPITYKSDVFSVFKDYVNKSEAHHNLKMVNLYCDNGREYLSNEMKNYCVERGITYHLTVPRTPQLNGVSERMNRTITEKARAMIAGANLNKIFWADAILSATYLINITPTRSLKCSKTPYELWHNKKPQIKYLKVFGSTAFVHIKTNKSKFDEKTWKGILVGYEPNGYRVWDNENEKYVVVRDAIIDERNFMVSRPVLESERVGYENSSFETDISEISSNIKGRVGENSGNKTDESKISGWKEISDTESNPSKFAKLDENIVDKSNNNIDNHPCSELRRSERNKGRPSVSYNEDSISNDFCFVLNRLCVIFLNHIMK